MQSHKLLLTSLFTAVALSASAQGTAFTYQGQLQNNGSPATGIYDLRFTIYDAVTNGNLLAGPLTNSATGAHSLLSIIQRQIDGLSFLSDR